MPLLRRAAVVAPLTALTALVTAAPAAAHEAWFVHHPERYPLEWSELVQPLTLAGAAAALVLAVVWRGVFARLPRPELGGALRRLEPLVPWVPRLLGLHLGASLLLLSMTGAVLDPAVQVSGAATVLLVPQVVVGSLLVLGRSVQWAALGVVAAGPVLLVLDGPRALFTCAVLVGIAGFLALVPPARERGGRAGFEPEQLRTALLSLRLGAAVSLISLAVVEKLANPAMGVAMLEQQPLLNVLSPIGVDAEAFVLVAGVVELLFGLLVLSGAGPQVVGLVAAVPFTATIFLFGATELIGHLPVYGVLLALVVLGSRASTSAELSWLPGRRREPVAA